VAITVRTLAIGAVFLIASVVPAAASMVDVSLQPSPTTVNVGDEFTLTVVCSASDSTYFDNVHLLIDYDSSKLSLDGTTDPSAVISYVLGVPKYDWGWPDSGSGRTVDVGSPVELPGLKFIALAPTNSTAINISGPIVDEQGQSFNAVKIDCNVNLTGTLTGAEVSEVSLATVPEPLTVVATFGAMSVLGIYVRRRTRSGSQEK
jgi:hypothetical protein